MSKEYTSSIVKKYGDSENVPKDVKTIFDIHDRQGSSILIDCIAEKIGSTANKFNMDSDERALLVKNILEELEAALNERVME